MHTQPTPTLDPWEHARALRDSGRPLEALQAYGAALDGTRTPAHLLEVAMLALRIEPPFAEKLAKKALACASTPQVAAYAAHALAEAYARQGRHRDAEPLFRAAVSQDGSLADRSAPVPGSPWLVRFGRQPCPSCGDAATGEIIYVGNATEDQQVHGQLDPIKVWERCGTCALVRVPEMPPPERLRAYYDVEAAAGIGDLQPPQGDAATHRLLQDEDAVRRILDVRRRLGHPSGGRLLEVGSAWGTFLAAAGFHGFDVLGIEASPRSSRWARATWGVEVIEGHAPDALPDGTFDVIALWEVIEHVPDPDALLSALAARLSPDGLLVLSTPTLDHPMHHALGYDDPMWRVPGHLVYYDENTLRAALGRVGLTVADRWMSSRYRGSTVVIGSPA